MTTSSKTVRWANLNNQEKVKQFSERGHGRVARNEMRSTCEICDQAINGGDNYFDINGAKFAHRACIVTTPSNLAKHGKIVTHKMMEALSSKKSTSSAGIKNLAQAKKPKAAALRIASKTETRATLSEQKPSKRGRKPKVQTKTSTELASGPAIKLSEVREALPGAIVTLTITGTVEAVQRALDKLQN